SRGSQNVVCLLPSSLERKDTLDWNEIAGLESVMNIGSTPFWGMQGADPEKYVGLIGRKLMGAASRARIQTHLWIQGFRIPARSPFLRIGFCVRNFVGQVNCGAGSRR